jgi:hypothetical protein
MKLDFVQKRLISLHEIDESSIRRLPLFLFIDRRRFWSVVLVHFGLMEGFSFICNFGC